MKIKILIVLLMVGAAGVILFLSLGESQKTWNGNVLIITLDTTRADVLGCYGNNKVKTPHLDRLGTDGIRFENCVSPVPLTLPSHCSIFTGQYPIGHGVRNNGTFYLNEKHQTLAEVFKGQGYQTFAVISAFVLLSKFGLKQGFDLYDDSLDSFKIVNTFQSEITADVVYEKFENWFSENWKKKFMAWVHFYDPHSPYQPPKAFIKKEEISDKRARYRGEVSFMDVQIGRIITDLEKKAILDDTLIIVVGDHGEAWGEHQEYAAHSVFCYRENIRVPFIIYNPKLLRKPAVIKDTVSTVDIMPTLLELAGMKSERDIQGRSLVGLMKNGHDPITPLIYLESMYGKEELGWAPLTGLIEGHYKYISLPEPELYHLGDDPGEKKNLVRIKSNVSRKMDKKLGEMVIRYSNTSGDSKRDLSQTDIQHLKSLGYISSFSGKAQGMVDPKKGILFNNRIKKISTLIKKNNLDQAEADINMIMTENPEMINYALISQLFKVHSTRRHTEKALNVLREGVRRFPEMVAFRTMMGQILYDQKRYEEVFDQCRNILEIDPKCTWAFILRGDSHEQLNNTGEALANYEKALELEPNNISMTIKYGELLIKSRQLAKALTVFNQILDNPDVWNSADILYKIALFNTSHGTIQKAEELMRRVIYLHPEGKYYFSYALILSKNKKFKEALDNMEIALNRYSGGLSENQKQTASRAVKVWKQAL
jgi:arylsulfatase A-like enzyme/tetratricopeptide (TPR) repeat protein